jgi:hypothetical protein
MSLCYEGPAVGTDAGYEETLRLQRLAEKQLALAPDVREFYANQFGIELTLIK